MGGIGSGNRWRYGTRSTTDDLRCLDVRLWARDGLLRPGTHGKTKWLRRGEVVASINVRAEHDRVILSYRHRRGGHEWKDEEYAVRLSRTPCTLGGTRPWFICPAVGCGRRVAQLYGGAIFACRYCHRLAYASTREDAGDRAARRADRIRERLGWDAGFLNGKGPKPRWMRWPTFHRLEREHDRLVSRSIGAIAHKFRLAGMPLPD